MEGVWCHNKQYVRRRTDQTFEKMKTLIKESREEFRKNDISVKLLKRFWRSCQGYKNGATYGDILKTYFSGKTKEKILAHRKIQNTLLN